MRITGCFGLLTSLFVGIGRADEVTFYRDVLPILQQKCQRCHRAGEIGPMRLLTYEQTRPWAKAIREAVLTKKMPPWFVEHSRMPISNDNSLSERQIRVLAAWVDGGSLAGDPENQPPPIEFVDGWNIPKPDCVMEMPSEFPVPATGALDYHYIVVPSHFTEDRWVQMVEVRPSNRSVVHHAVIYIREPGSNWLRDRARPGIPFREHMPSLEPRGEHFTAYTPGMVPENWGPDAAKLVKAGSDFVFSDALYTNRNSCDGPHEDRACVCKRASSPARSDSGSGEHIVRDPPGQRAL
jgi:hypothetical protein